MKCPKPKKKMGKIYLRREDKWFLRALWVFCKLLLILGGLDFFCKWVPFTTRRLFQLESWPHKLMLMGKNQLLKFIMVLHSLSNVLLLIIADPIVFVNEYLVNKWVISHPKWNLGWWPVPPSKIFKFLKSPWRGKNVKKITKTKVPFFGQIVAWVPRWQFLEIWLVFSSTLKPFQEPFKIPMDSKCQIWASCVDLCVFGGGGRLIISLSIPKKIKSWHALKGARMWKTNQQKHIQNLWKSSSHQQVDNFHIYWCVLLISCSTF